jgi:glycosyltransferase involved in cell wall biosynthesis
MSVASPDELREISRARGAGPYVSVIVVSYRRHDEIVRCLRDLAAQETRVPFEVVLLLQAYPPGMPENLAAMFSRHLRLSVFHAAHGLGVHAARNAALARSAGEVVAFLDDDVRVLRRRVVRWCRRVRAASGQPAVDDSAPPPGSWPLGAAISHRLGRVPRDPVGLTSEAGSGGRLAVRVQHVVPASGARGGPRVR